MPPAESCAIVGAGDYIGAAIARKFAREGYAVFAGRRTAEKLQPLKREIEATGGVLEARVLDDGVIDPRDTRKVVAFCLSLARAAAARNLKPLSFGVARP